MNHEPEPGFRIRTTLTNRGIEITLGHSKTSPLTPDDTANQAKPRAHYVYAHTDNDGTIFYLGKGSGRRAWSRGRHPLWVRYVDRHLQGDFRILILKDNLSPEEAEDLEAQWIAQCSPNLVNWQDMGRPVDVDLLNRYEAKRDRNLDLIGQAMALERTDLEQAVLLYVSAIDAVSKCLRLILHHVLTGVKREP